PDWHAGRSDASGTERPETRHDTRSRARRTTRTNRPRVRRNNPGAVFRTGGRASSVTAAVLCLLCMYVVFSEAQVDTMPAGVHSLYQLGLVLLGVGAVGLVGSALVPRLRMQVNSEGLLI